MTNTKQRPGEPDVLGGISLKIDGEVLVISREKAADLIASLQADLLHHWRRAGIAVVRAEGLKLGRTAEGFVLRIESPELGPFVLDLGPTGLAELVRAYNRRMS